jgi:hypothetical protein
MGTRIVSSIEYVSGSIRWAGIETSSSRQQPAWIIPQKTPPETREQRSLLGFATAGAALIAGASFVHG